MMTQSTEIKCPHCGSEDVVKAGPARNTRQQGQKYQCKGCVRTFSVFPNESSEAKVEVKVEPKAEAPARLCPTCGRPTEGPLPEKIEAIDITSLSEVEAAKVNWAINYMKEHPEVGLKGLNNVIKVEFGKGLRDKLRYNVFKGVKAGIY